MQQIAAYSMTSSAATSSLSGTVLVAAGRSDLSWPPR
jgi:hypothetical protein